MTMGQRIRTARIEAGLSQRQLAGDTMTRNMLSALEHDAANPSVGTLKYLSQKLCKPISYFLGEDPSGVPEAAEMDEVRKCFAAEEHSQCLKKLERLKEPAFAAERALLETMCLLALAQKAREEGKMPYSMELLRRCERAMEMCPYMKGELNRKWLVASAQAAGEKGRSYFAAKLQADDEVLLLRAQNAMDWGEFDRAGRLLEAADDRRSGQWNWLRGEVYLFYAEYAKAAECYHKAEGEFPEKTAEKLEICYREMEDYKMAYFYAKKVEK